MSIGFQMHRFRYLIICWLGYSRQEDMSNCSHRMWSSSETRQVDTEMILQYRMMQVNHDGVRVRGYLQITFMEFADSEHLLIYVWNSMHLQFYQVHMYCWNLHSSCYVILMLSRLDLNVHVLSLYKCLKVEIPITSQKSIWFMIVFIGICIRLFSIWIESFIWYILLFNMTLSKKHHITKISDQGPGDST